MNQCCNSDPIVDRNTSWLYIVQFKQLSEKFIEKHADKIDWHYVSRYQQLSESFIERRANKVNWHLISRYQQLSEAFIEKHANKVNWYYIAQYQQLSPEFARKHNLVIYIDNRSVEDRRAEMATYAKKWDLRFEDDTLYAYRNHDQQNRGSFNHLIHYNELKRYEDWHCDMNPENENSFGLGIWPEGNVQVSVHLDDWGTIVTNDGYGKCRVKAFTLLSFPEVAYNYK